MMHIRLLMDEEVIALQKMMRTLSEGLCDGVAKAVMGDTDFMYDLVVKLNQGFARLILDQALREMRGLPDQVAWKEGFNIPGALAVLVARDDGQFSWMAAFEATRRHAAQVGEEYSEQCETCPGRYVCSVYEDAVANGEAVSRELLFSDIESFLAEVQRRMDDEGR